MYYLGGQGTPPPSSSLHLESGGRDENMKVRVSYFWSAPLKEQKQSVGTQPLTSANTYSIHYPIKNVFMYDAFQESVPKYSISTLQALAAQITAFSVHFPSRRRMYIQNESDNMSKQITLRRYKKLVKRKTSYNNERIIVTLAFVTFIIQAIFKTCLAANQIKTRQKNVHN